MMGEGNEKDLLPGHLVRVFTRSTFKGVSTHGVGLVVDDLNSPDESKRFKAFLVLLDGRPQVFWWDELEEVPDG
jgi:hypothetical protein